MKLNMLTYYRMIMESHVNIIYCGPIWADGIEGLGGTLKKRLEIDELPLSASQSVFSVFVEQMNNILMYSDEKECFTGQENKNINVSKGMFVLGVHEKKYFIQCGNIIRNEKCELIRNKIEYINTLDKAALRKYYKEQIKGENTNPESKGAGLGLIEIARRSGSKINYSFTPQEDGFAFFMLNVTIG